MYKLGRFSPAIRAQMIYTPPYDFLVFFDTPISLTLLFTSI